MKAEPRIYRQPCPECSETTGIHKSGCEIGYPGANARAVELMNDGYRRKAIQWERCLNIARWFMRESGNNANSHLRALHAALNDERMAEALDPGPQAPV